MSRVAEAKIRLIRNKLLALIETDDISSDSTIEDIIERIASKM
jgi:hypothetical protein